MATGQVYHTRKQVAEIKRTRATAITKSLTAATKWASGLYAERKDSIAATVAKVDGMTTRQIYAFMKDNGYTFDANRARWIAGEVSHE